VQMLRIGGERWAEPEPVRSGFGRCAAYSLSARVGGSAATTWRGDR
jgi:hypothetical protein